jgi:UDP-glucuronate 4-epimerase
MKILVTGAAGFIGSHLCEKLLKDHHNQVIGIDTFIGPTPPQLKQNNVTILTANPRFQLIKTDLLALNLEMILHDIDVIYHLAGMPGVRSSWGKEFDPYVMNNIIATQRLLEAAKDNNISKFIYASTSSIYGEKDGKVAEDSVPTPLSPYGITKLSGEHLCHVYQKSYQLPVIILRFFTVYGPRQRPDMAFHRFIVQMLKDETVTIYGDGLQTRDFTYISDCVDAIANVLHKNELIGKTLNIGGKERASIKETISILEELLGKQAKLHLSGKISGEPKHTWADISLAEELLDYKPKWALKEGLQEEINYIRKVYSLS